MEAARANIFRLFLDAGGKACDGRYGVLRKAKLHALGVKKCNGLLEQGVLCVGQDADEVFFLKRLQLDADRQAALQLGDQVRRLGDMKCSGGDEEDVVGADHSVARGDGGALDG